jgi:L,D-transpeptidase YcbB
MVVPALDMGRVRSKGEGAMLVGVCWKELMPHFVRSVFIPVIVLGLNVAVFLSFAVGRAQAFESEPIAAQIRAVIERDAVVDGMAEVRRIYRDLHYAPIWHGTPNAPRRRESLRAALSRATDDGLPAHVFSALMSLEFWSDAPDAATAARRDIDMTRVLYEYVAGQARGFTPRAALGKDWMIVPAPFDAAAVIVTAVVADDIDRLGIAAVPSFSQYQNLRVALARLRTIAAAGGWPVILGSEELLLGTGDVREWLLIARLVIEGDLPTPGTASDALALAASVRQFQTRHGLEPDGRIGRRTLMALSMTTQARIDAVAANLERWRHLPRAWGDSYVHVNAADAGLVLVEKGVEVLRMRTIIGDPDHPTPVMQATITGVTINPPWTIPTSIATRETLPKLKRNPRYLADNNMIIVGRSGDDPHGLFVDWKNISPRAFPFVLRQQPGVKSALGAVKFEMANENAVFLHDTPARGLFARADRGLSHGCVRLERPIDLACHVLFGVASDDNRAEIVKIIESGVTRTLPIPTPLPVYILYWTAFVDHDGLLHIRPDIYGRDPAIMRALASLTVGGRLTP